MKEARDAGRIALDTIEIANVMGRYTGDGGGPDFAKHILSLFDLSDPEVSIEIAGGEVLHGPDAVTTYWKGLQGVYDRNGGALGAHMLTSPVIVVADDGLTAKGQWQDVGTTLFGPGMGVIPPDGQKYSAIREVSRYIVDFNRTDDGWKIKSLTWKILWTWPGEPIDESSSWISSPTLLPQPPK